MSANHNSAMRPAPLTGQFVNFLVAIFSLLLCGCSAMYAEKSSTEPKPSKLSVVPASIDFQSVAVGERNSQTLKITNVSTATVDLRQFHLSGTGFSLPDAKAPLILGPGRNEIVSVVFAPATSAAVTGSLLIVSPDLNSPVTVPLSGSGERPSPQLKLSTASVNFGSHTVNSSASQAVTLTNTGNVRLKLDSISPLGSPFAVVGLTPGVSLAPDQRLDFQVWFRPASAGTSSTTIAIASADLGAPLRLTVSGSAKESSSGSPDSGARRTVTLAWNASSDSASGYNVYRSSTPGGAYNRVNGHVISGLTYRDADIESGRYFYVVTGVAPDGTESAYSNEVAVEIPNG